MNDDIKGWFVLVFGAWLVAVGAGAFVFVVLSAIFGNKFRQ